jgi:hypothetical protein
MDIETIYLVINSVSIIFSFVVFFFTIYYWFSTKKSIDNIRSQEEEYFRLRNIELEKIISEATGARHAIITLYDTLKQNTKL